MHDSAPTSATRIHSEQWSRDGPVLTEDHLREYRERGFTQVTGILTAEEADVLRCAFENVVAAPSIHARVHRAGGDSSRFLVDMLMSARSDQFLSLALDHRVLRVAAHFIGDCSFNFFYDQLFYKDAGAGSRTQWHQDLAFWPLQGERIPSIWIALTEVDELSSAVQYLPGSHLMGQIYAAVDPEERDKARAAGASVCPDFHLDESRVALVCHRLQPGDAIVHHPLVIHGAGPNLSSSHRLAVSLRYFASDTVWAPRANTMYFPHSEVFSAGTPVGEMPMFRACSLSTAPQLTR